MAEPRPKAWTSGLRGALLAVLLGGLAAPAVGQTVVGRLVDQATGQPLEAAFVSLLDSLGTERGGALTNAQGRYVLRAPAPGRYTVRAELIGYASHTSPPLDLEADRTRTYDMAVSFQAIQLESIEVSGEQRCTVRPESGLRTADVWDEAQKALRLAAWTEEQGAVQFSATRYELDLDPETLRVLTERRSRRSGFSRGSPYQSYPAEDLAENGYVRRAEDGTWDYLAPDARVLLSDSFLDGHCFELREHETRPELIGLGFRPVGRGEGSDIRGVLWLDRESSELRWLEFTYTDLPYPVESDLLGGRVVFDRLGGGPWIVRSWRIRMPEVTLAREGFGPLRMSEARYRLTGIREVGAEVREVVDEGGASPPEEAVGGGAVAGVVYDRGGSATAADVEVSVVGSERRVRTDADGRFGVHGLREGRYRLRVTPADWDLPWPAPVAAEVPVQEGDTGRVVLRLPTPVETVRSLCGEAVSDTLPGVIVGRVTDASGRALPDREVVVAWVGFQGVRGGLPVRGRWSGASVTTDETGWYRVCGVPLGAPVRLRAVPDHADPDGVAARLWRPDAPLATDAREVRLREGALLERVPLEARGGGSSTSGAPGAADAQEFEGLRWGGRKQKPAPTI